MLETAPSFSIYSTNTGEGEEEEKENGLESEDTKLVRSVTILENIEGKVVGSGDFSFIEPNMDLIKEEGDEVEDEVVDALEKLGTQEVDPPPSPPMYLAAGLGIKNGAESFQLDKEYSEEYYRELLEEYPNHPLILSNYAKFLQSKGDLPGAEYYYFRATQADPGDGDIMSQYAKLMWELHRDREKALTYFEHAVQTAPADSDVLAAYAKFLWEIDDDSADKPRLPNNVQMEETQKVVYSVDVGSENFDAGNAGLVNGAGDANETDNIEEYCKRMIEENSSDPLFLKSYAQFLYQSKGDLKGAEEYYSRAYLADPQDGEILSQYAKLVWELHHDQDKALGYFEQAIEAAPGNSNVLAAYASFLWAVDDDEVDEQLGLLTERALAGCTGVATT